MTKRKFEYYQHNNKKYIKLDCLKDGDIVLVEGFNGKLSQQIVKTCPTCGSISITGFSSLVIKVLEFIKK